MQRAAAARGRFHARVPAPDRNPGVGSDPGGVLAEPPDGAPGEDDQPGYGVDGPGPVDAHAEQRRVHQLVEPVQGRVLGDVLQDVRELAQRDEQAPGEGTAGPARGPGTA